MIDKLNRIQAQLESLEAKMPEIVEKATAGLVNEMAEMNRQQLNAGLRADGTRITPHYRPYTIARKRKLGQPTDRVTLRDRGDYQDRIKYKAFTGMVEAQSEDEKDEALQRKYGAGILGLTEENLSKIRESALPTIINEARKILL